MSTPRDLGEPPARALAQVHPQRVPAVRVDALARLLIAKGVFTEAEWLEAQRLELNEGVAKERDREARRPVRMEPP